MVVHAELPPLPSSRALSKPQVLEQLDALRMRLGSTPTAERLHKLTREIASCGLPNLAPLLPLLLNLKGKPYSLDRHFPFEPFFNTYLPRAIVLRTGRQVSKSTSLAAQGVVSSNCIPFFNTLYVTPLFETIRRFSGNYVRRFIEESPFRTLWTGPETTSSVLQRSFRNFSTMFFSYAFLDAERTRGINADRVVFDEVQNMDHTFIPVIQETLSGSERWGLTQYAGTAKTTDNTLERLWRDSSMAEWVIKCHRSGCRYFNIPALEHDLDAMLGPTKLNRTLSEAEPGVVCARCQKPLLPRTGRWVHRKPDRMLEFAGYHVPQLILPMHFSITDKWNALLAKRAGAFGTQTSTFYNEVCGEAYDVGTKLITETDLRRAGVLGPNDIEKAVLRLGNYEQRVLSIDWGGGGEAGISWTVWAVLGWDGSGKIDVIYGHRSYTPHDQVREADLCLMLADLFKCHYLVHDYNGAGMYREKYVIDAGYPYERVIPVAYVRAATQRMMRRVEATHDHPRERYHLDRPRSLVMLCHQIREGQVRFFDYDHKSDSDPGLLSDFLALVEEKTDSRLGRDLYTIQREQNRSDDFAHAVNTGACWLWYLNEAWPKATSNDRYQLSKELLQMISPMNPDWYQ